MRISPQHGDRLQAAAAGSEETCCRTRFKFTAEGGVKLNVSAAVGGWSASTDPEPCPAVVAFEVTDTGIGIRRRNRN